MLEPVPVQCPHCGEMFEVVVDESGGAAQTYVEDCPVCCHPSTVRIRLDEYGDPQVDLDRE